MNFYKNLFFKQPDIRAEIKNQELKLENTINKFRIFFIAFLIITDYILMFYLDQMDTYKIEEEILGLSIAATILAYIHYTTKKHSNKPWLKYFTLILDFLIVFLCYFAGKDALISATNIKIEEYLLLITTLIIIINIISAFRVQLSVIILSTFFSLISNLIILDHHNTHYIIIVYTTLIIILSGFFTIYVSRFIFNFFVANHKLSSALDELKEAHNEIIDQNHELEVQNKHLAEQRDQITLQKRNITNSINYASKIQKAVLGSSEEIKNVAPDSFIVFKPKDIVSGDFYWFKQAEVFTKKYNIFAAVDCTGHGVPGAFMSMLGTSFLNDIVSEFYDELDVSLMLNRLRQEVKSHLKQDVTELTVKDGMDMALCAIDYDEMVLQYSGANSPLYIIRNANAYPHSEIEEYKPDRMPIGVYRKEKESFTNHKINICKGDLIYLFSDGYLDQFGGETGEKFKKKRFNNLLLSISNLPMEKQKIKIEETLNEWKGDNKQIDDITVIGVKI